jgi:aminodeoxyfutalosine deaminase
MTTPSADALAALPKIELHVHLEGSIRADTAIELARRHGEDPSEVLVLGDDGYPAPFRDFDHFVATFVATSRQVRRPEDLRTVAADFARNQLRQGVLYTEATFTAHTLVAHGWEPTAMWQAVREGFAEVADTDVRLIVDVPRDAGVAAAERTIELVESADAPIVGLGLTGIEGAVPERDFAMLRDAADRLGLGLAVHAGETGSPDNIRAALDDLGADRIGHGIAAVRDDALLARLAADGVPVEVCPSSNVSLGLVDDLDAHPLPKMAAADLELTINSDDPPFFSTTLTEELGHAARLLELDLDGLRDLQHRAARAAFVDDETRSRLLAAIDAG